mgnify:FL=1
MTDQAHMDPASCEARLSTLREQGAQQLDPVRFQYLATLAQRLPTQTPGVALILANKLRAGLSDYEQRLSESGSKKTMAPSAKHSSPLADLNRYIQTLSSDSADPVSHPAHHQQTEMKSVRAFSEVWSKIAAENQVDAAFGRGPENAGPLNSHMLVLRSLELMRALSPDYLRRFLSHADSLLWIEQVNQQYALSDNKPARRTSPTGKRSAGKVNKA